MSAASDLAADLLWPLVAVTLVLLGMTFATSGRRTAPQAFDQRSAAASTGGAGGRRATDRLPGERTMVVVTGETSADTVRQAIAGARGSAGPAGSGPDVLLDPRRPHPQWESRA